MDDNHPLIDEAEEFQSFLVNYRTPTSYTRTYTDITIDDGDVSIYVGLPPDEGVGSFNSEYRLAVVDAVRSLCKRPQYTISERQTNWKNLSWPCYKVTIDSREENSRRS